MWLVAIRKNEAKSRGAAGGCSGRSKSTLPDTLVVEQTFLGEPELPGPTYRGSYGTISRLMC